MDANDSDAASHCARPAARSRAGSRRRGGGGGGGGGGGADLCCASKSPRAARPAARELGPVGPPACWCLCKAPAAVTADRHRVAAASLYPTPPPIHERAFSWCDSTMERQGAVFKVLARAGPLRCARQARWPSDGHLVLLDAAVDVRAIYRHRVHSYRCSNRCPSHTLRAARSSSSLVTRASVKAACCFASVTAPTPNSTSAPLGWISRSSQCSSEVRTTRA